MNCIKIIKNCNKILKSQFMSKRLFFNDEITSKVPSQKQENLLLNSFVNRELFFLREGQEQKKKKAGVAKLVLLTLKGGYDYANRTLYQNQ